MFAQSLWGGGSPFERAISALTPLAWYRFRDTDFSSTIEDSSGNNYDLTKQIATAARSAVATRTTHPGGAYFPAVTFDNWATQGTFYKGTTGLLSGVTQYTALVSFRMIAAPTSGFNRIFGVGTENVAETGTNDLVFFKASAAAPTNPHYWKHRSNSGGLIPVSPAVTELFKDGVNRLLIVRYAYNSIYRMTSSKPGHEALTEGSADAASGTGLDAIAKALVLNARGDTNTGSSTTPSMVIDQIALFSTDIGATAEANLHSLWCDEVAAAGYYPSMMDFDGSTGYYSKTYTATGNKVTTVMSFSTAAFTGGPRRMAWIIGAAGGRLRTLLSVASSDDATVARRNKLLFVVQNSAGTSIVRLFSIEIVNDGEEHTVFASFDGDAGTAIFYIDGVNADDTGNAERIAPTTGTLDATATAVAYFGANGVGPIEFFSGNIGFVGHRDAYLTNYTDFMDGNLPKAIDEKNWAEWDGRSAGDIGMTQFDGSTGYYLLDPCTTNGNACTVVFRVLIEPFSGGVSDRIILVDGDINTKPRIRLTLYPNDFAAVDRRNKLSVYGDDATSEQVFLFSSMDICDGEEHTVFISLDATAGTAIFIVDGVDAIDDSVVGHNAMNTYTMVSGSSSRIVIGANFGFTEKFGGQLGFFGYRDAYLTNWADFMQADGTPKDIDETTWAEWGAQPLLWNEHGDMVNNLGSAGAMTANGTIKPPRPAFWSHTGQMDNNKGSAGDMTANGTITMTEGGSP